MTTYTTKDCEFCYRDGQASPAVVVAPHHRGGDTDRPARWVPVCAKHFRDWFADVSEDEELPAFSFAAPVAPSVDTERLVAALKVARIMLACEVRAYTERGAPATAHPIQECVEYLDATIESAPRRDSYTEPLALLRILQVTADSAPETGHTAAEVIAGNWDVLGPRLAALCAKYNLVGDE